MNEYVIRNVIYIKIFMWPVSHETANSDCGGVEEALF